MKSCLIRAQMLYDGSSIEVYLMRKRMISTNYEDLQLVKKISTTSYDDSLVEAPEYKMPWDNAASKVEVKMKQFNEKFSKFFPTIELEQFKKGFFHSLERCRNNDGDNLFPHEIVKIILFFVQCFNDDNKKDKKNNLVYLVQCLSDIETNYELNNDCFDELRKFVQDKSQQSSLNPINQDTTVRQNLTKSDTKISPVTNKETTYEDPGIVLYPVLEEGEDPDKDFNKLVNHDEVVKKYPDSVIFLQLRIQWNCEEEKQYKEWKISNPRVLTYQFESPEDANIDDAIHITILTTKNADKSDKAVNR